MEEAGYQWHACSFVPALLMTEQAPPCRTLLALVLYLTRTPKQCQVTTDRNYEAVKFPFSGILSQQGEKMTSATACSVKQAGGLSEQQLIFQKPGSIPSAHILTALRGSDTHFWPPQKLHTCGNTYTCRQIPLYIKF